MALSKEVVEYVLESAVPEQGIENCFALIQGARGQFSIEAGQAIADYLAATSADPARRDFILAGLLEQGQSSPLARFVWAGLLAHGGKTEAAIDALRQTMQALPGPNPQILLQRARLLTRQQRFAVTVHGG